MYAPNNYCKYNIVVPILRYNNIIIWEIHFAFSIIFKYIILHIL